MTKNENLRLCGGTFFTLLLEARKQLLGANEHYAGKKDGLTEYETLIGLARVIRSDLATPMPTEIKTILVTLQNIRNVRMQAEATSRSVIKRH